jgi:hypothetical protein
MGNAVLQGTDFAAQKCSVTPAAAQATGPIIRAIVSLIEHRDMPPLLAVSPIPGNLASAQAALKRTTAHIWINAI